MTELGYEVIEEKTKDIVKFFFFSEGKSDIAKAIEYSYAGRLPNGKRIYNLAFGDYNGVTGEMNDHNNSNNEDHYKVLNTVLNSIPDFLDENRNSAVMVRGSDSGLKFIKKCKLTCNLKKCYGDVNCRKQNRRINIYRGYVDKNWESLNLDYKFYGGNPLASGILILNCIQVIKNMILYW